MSEGRRLQTLSLKTNDFDELQEAAADWDQQYCQLSSGPFEGGLDLSKVGSMEILRERWGRQIKYQGTAPKGTYGFALQLGDAGTASWNGYAACADSVIVQAPDREADLVSPSRWDSIVMSVAEDEVHSIVSSLSDHPFANAANHCVIPLSHDGADRLRATGTELLDRSMVATAGEERSIEEAIERFVWSFLGELVSASDGQRIAVEPTKAAKIVKRTTELVLSTPQSPMGLVEICGELDVSLRTLHLAFQDVVGVPPATWLRSIRLNRVRRRLARSSPSEVQIKRVAMENGFIHLGHFGTQYRRLFGCLPSQTLGVSSRGSNVPSRRRD